MYFVYILCCADGSLYTGCAKNVDERVKKHNSGKGARYTAGRLPVKLMYFEEQPDKGSALRREAAIKKLTREQKLLIIKGS